MPRGIVASAVKGPLARASPKQPRCGKLLAGRVPVRVARLRAATDEELLTEGPEPVPLPEGATEPKRIPDIPPGLFGFVDYAERLNSRVAMIGFVGILIVELFANQGILQLAGFDIGSGLGFEF